MSEIQDLVFCAKYPFTKQAKVHLQTLGLDFDKLDNDTVEIAVNRINSVLLNENDSKKRLSSIQSSKTSFLMSEIVNYPIAKLLVALNGDYYIRKQFASAESRDVYYFLQLDYEENVMEVAQQIFNLKREEDKFILPVIEYLNNIPEGNEYKLVNSELDNGFVYAEKETVAKLVSRFVFNSIMETKADKKNFPKMFSFFAEELSKHRKESLEMHDFGPLNPEYFPPCIKRIVSNLRSGELVGHQPRFVLSTFFSSIKMPVDKAVDYFREQPNFNEKMTKYHLEHAMGKKGGTKYTAPACSTVESYGLCFKDNTCKWKHPLVYYKNMKSRRVK